jgi:hypothetical protein
MSRAAAPTWRAIVINIVLFQIGWFACVAGGARGAGWVGSALTLLIVAWHLACAQRPALELRTVAGVTLLGGVWDSVLAAHGGFNYASGMFSAFAAPHWIFALWALFATTLNVSLRWLRGRYIVSALLGAVSGPFVFWAGQQLHAVQFASPAPALALQAAGWAVLLPLCVYLASHSDGYAASASPAPTA